MCIEGSILKVFIIGISGKTGSRIAHVLRAQGYLISGLSVSVNDFESFLPSDYSIVAGDVASLTEHELASAVSGMDAIVFTAGAPPEDSAAVDAVDGDGLRKSIAAAQIAGVSNFLLLSVFPEAGRGSSTPRSLEYYMEVKKKADVDLAHSDLDWLVLRHPTLTDVPATGRICLGAAELFKSLSRDDLAETVASLLASNVRKQVLEVTTGRTCISDAVVDLLLE